MPACSALWNAALPPDQKASDAEEARTSNATANSSSMSSSIRSDADKSRTAAVTARTGSSSMSSSIRSDADKASTSSATASSSSMSSSSSSSSRGAWHPTWGDRCQQIVWIGVDMDEAGLRAMLDSCLLRDDEMALGPEGWVEAFDDPLPPWEELGGDEEEGEEEEWEVDR